MMTSRTVSAALMVLAMVCSSAAGQAAKPPANLLGNGSFELGRQFWTMDAAGKTAARFEVNKEQAGDGENSAVVTVEAVDSWGVQFGQSIEAGAKGKTYTFAALARSTGEPVNLSLQVERRADPWDKAARTDSVAVGKDQWTELHVTFKVSKDFREGWFAYVACSQPKCQFRLDLVRLYEGEYTPYAEIRKQEAARAGVGLYDTGAPAAAEIAPADVDKKPGWSALPEDKLDHAFKGDAAMVNNRLAVVVRRGAGCADVYSLAADGPVRRCAIRPAADGAGEFTSIRTLANNPGEVTLEAACKGKDGKPLTMAVTLRMGQAYVQVQSSLEAVWLEAPCRFAVMPDFFADDIVVDAEALAVPKAQLPGDNFLMHMTEGGDAIVMAVWSHRDRDVGVELSGAAGARRITRTEIACGPKDKAWVAVLEGKGIWHRRDIAKGDAGKLLKLDWKPPLSAAWRVDWQRSDKLFDSWEMLRQQPGGEFVKQGLTGSPETVPPDRNRWTTVLGTFAYPCWIDKSGLGNLQPIRSEKLHFEGPAIVYPLSRTAATPLEAYTVADIVRATLGVGPCEYVLDVEGQQSQSKGRATCANRDTLNPIYESRQQKQRRAEVDKSLTEVMIFIRFIRQRIEGYVAFSHEVAKYLDEQKKVHPDLAKELDELSALAGMVDKRLAARKEGIKTPDLAQALVDEFRRSGMDDEGKNAFENCKKFTAAVVDIGSNQDELVGECRWAVKVLRQQAGLMMAADARLAEIAREIRTRSQAVLRTPAGHEGARH